MSGALSPLNLVLRDLVALARRRATGLFCIVTEDNRFASIKLREGKVLEVMYRSQFNEAAVEMLAQMAWRAPRSRRAWSEHSSMAHPANPRCAGCWAVSRTRPIWRSAPPSPAALNGSISDVHKRVIEEIAMGFLGPIASVVCDGVFETAHDLDAIIREIGSNLTDSEEAARFGTAVRGALGAR